MSDNILKDFDWGDKEVMKECRKEHTDITNILKELRDKYIGYIKEYAPDLDEEEFIAKMEARNRETQDLIDTVHDGYLESLWLDEECPFCESNYCDSNCKCDICAILYKDCWCDRGEDEDHEERNDPATGEKNKDKWDREELDREDAILEARNKVKALRGYLKGI